MARLALVRKRREEAEARKAEEAAGAGSAAKEKMEKEAKAKAGGSGPQKLNPLEVSRGDGGSFFSRVESTFCSNFRSGCLRVFLSGRV